MATIVATAATGVTRLAGRHDFGARKDLRLSVDDATQQLRAAVRCGDAYTADLWAALVSDAAVRERNKVKEAEPTPLCLMFGQGHQHFLERLSVVPREASFSRGSGRNEQFISPTACLTEALFVPWARPDAMPSFRWDPHEDVRYALRAADPTTLSTKETTQHGANRLAAVGLTALTVVPERRAGKPRLGILGGGRDPDGAFTLHLHMAALAGSARDSMRTMTRNLPGHAGDALLRSGTSEPESAAEQADADRSAEQDTHDAPGPRGGDSHDPRSLEDKTRRSIAYLLIALLAFLVIALLAMVVPRCRQRDRVLTSRTRLGNNCR